MNKEEEAIREDQERPNYHWNQKADRKHPQWKEYCSYRSAMVAQEVSCPTFEQWLITEEKL